MTTINPSEVVDSASPGATPRAYTGPTHYMTLENQDSEGHPIPLIPVTLRTPWIQVGGQARPADHLTTCIFNFSEEQVRKLKEKFSSLEMCVEKFKMTEFHCPIKYDLFGQALIAFTVLGIPLEFRDVLVGGLTLIDETIIPCDRYKWNPHVTLVELRGPKTSALQNISNIRTNMDKNLTLRIAFNTLCLRAMHTDTLIAQLTIPGSMPGVA